MKRGQSTVEYILLVTAVIAVVIFFTTGKESGFQKKLHNVINMTTDDMEKVAERINP